MTEDMKSGVDDLGHYWVLTEGKEYTCGMCNEDIVEGEKAYEFYQQDDPRPTRLTLCQNCMRNVKVAKAL